MSLGRRVLIRNAALVAAAQGCARRIEPPPVVSAPEDAAGRITIDAPELSKNGGSVTVHLSNGLLLLVANVQGTIIAIDGSCPHAGCNLAWVPEDRQVECPCHGSRFTSDGAVLNPPARTDLRTFPVTVDPSGKVIVTFYPGDGTYPAPDAQGRFTIDLASYPSLAAVGGIVQGEVAYPPGRLMLIRVSATQINAVSADCPHMHCTVRPKGDGATLHCPCHGSDFHFDGSVVTFNQPANSPLGRFATALSGQTLTVDLGTQV